MGEKVIVIMPVKVWYHVRQISIPDHARDESGINQGENVMVKFPALDQSVPVPCAVLRTEDHQELRIRE